MISLAQRPAGRRGVVAWLEPQPNGRVLLVLDDVRADDAGDRSTWQAECLFTETTFDRDAFLDSALSEGDLANIGLAVVARLAAKASPP